MTYLHIQYWLTIILIKHINVMLNIHTRAVIYAFDHNLIDIIKTFYQYGCRYIKFQNNYYSININAKKEKERHIKRQCYIQPI